MNAKMSVLAAIAVSVAAAATNSVLAAEPLAGARQQVVQFADLNLATDEGGATLYHRIRAAANHVCQPIADIRELTQMTRSKVCVDRAIEQAIRVIGNPTLIQRYVVRSRTPQELIAQVSR